MPTKPYADSRLTRFLGKRILELRSIKSQAQVAAEAGFLNPSMLSMLKNGSAPLPIDRVPALATALDVDPRYLLQLALEQRLDATAMRTLEDILGTIVTRNEIVWLNELRDASGHTNPTLTARARSTLRSIFGK
ncbi:helix-turn-helix domain-containing protein [Pelagibacterium lacus]|uniref:XRE family transcriptional regulator n=1 Tax=Pelagibacterium lacus TaxID=2282655 RepID=A0A369W6E7_9HYPH|nr:helix-turn-helix transcriptional regulator [Pelagibacterium lacus]RDE07651.1 XRE family transcriptional regulator [Pelagibacterium lacus]